MTPAPADDHGEHKGPGALLNLDGAPIRINFPPLVMDGCSNENEHGSVFKKYILRRDSSTPPASHHIGRSELEAEEIQSLLDLDHEAIMVRINILFDQLNRRPPAKVEFSSIHDEEELAEVRHRLSRYRRVEAHESSLPQEEQGAEKLCSRRRSEEDAEWYFHPKQCKLAGLDDHQRLVLRDDFWYRDWDYYRLTYLTYQGDVEYVQFCDEMAKKIEWMDDEEALFGDQWSRYELMAFLQTLEIAVRFRNIFARSVMSALREHIDGLRSDFDQRKEWDGVYFEIWKRVAQQKMNLKEALQKLYEENVFPIQRHAIKSALDDYPDISLLKYNYDNFVDGIDGTVSEDKAHSLIIEAVEKMFPRRKNYLDYVRKKMEIAKRIGLVP